MSDAALVPTVVDELMDFTVIATSPKDMEAGQRSLILWTARKIQSIKTELAEAKEQLQLAIQNKWKRDGWQRQVRKHQWRIEFYKKVKAALEAGYYIVPPFPVEIFAIRTERRAPEPARQRNAHNHDQAAENLPVGAGRYVDPRPTIKSAIGYVQKEGKTIEVQQYYASDFRAVDFPFKLAKAEVMGATAKAMALKIFDRFGVLPTTRKPDPIIVGQIILPNQPSYMKRHPEVLNFFVAWWLNTNSLPK